jgi:hypothetical protein
LRGLAETTRREECKKGGVTFLLFICAWVVPQAQSFWRLDGRPSVKDMEVGSYSRELVYKELLIASPGFWTGRPPSQAENRNIVDALTRTYGIVRTGLA